MFWEMTQGIVAEVLDFVIIVSQFELIRRPIHSALCYIKAKSFGIY